MSSEQTRTEQSDSQTTLGARSRDMTGTGRMSRPANTEQSDTRIGSYVWLVWGRVDYKSDGLLLRVLDTREEALGFERDVLDQNMKVRGHTYHECWTTPWEIKDWRS